MTETIRWVNSLRVSDILKPNGQPANDQPDRPSNEKTLEFINRQVQEQEASELTEKIVQLEPDKMASPELLERRRKQLTVATQIVMQDLHEDALLLEASAKEQMTPLQEGHDKMAMARAFRMTMGWMQGKLATADCPPPEAPKRNAS